MPTARWSSRQGPNEHLPCEEFAHTRNVMVRCRTTSQQRARQEFNDVINSKTLVKQLQQLLTDGRNRFVTQANVSNLYRNVGNAGCWVLQRTPTAPVERNVRHRS